MIGNENENKNENENEKHIKKRKRRNNNENDYEIYIPNQKNIKKNNFKLSRLGSYENTTGENFFKIINHFGLTRFKKFLNDKKMRISNMTIDIDVQPLFSGIYINIDEFNDKYRYDKLHFSFHHDKGESSKVHFCFHVKTNKSLIYWKMYEDKNDGFKFRDTTFCNTNLYRDIKIILDSINEYYSIVKLEYQQNRNHFQKALNVARSIKRKIGGSKEKNKLNSIKKKYLLEYCKKNKLKDYSEYNKKDLINFIKKKLT